MRTRRHAFTLVELLVVIGVIAVLIGILVPTLARARRAAGEAQSLSNIRQMMLGYTSYHTDNRGALLFGYPPDTVSGVPVTADDPVSRHTFSSVVAGRYPWRLVRYVANVWPILHTHAPLPALTQPGDTASAAFGKAYVLSINPTYGINAVFLGGHKDFDGFVGAENRPNVRRHVAFRASEVRRPSDIVVFADCTSAIAQAEHGHKAGYAILTPPRARGVERWRVGHDGIAVSARPPYELVGLPHGWFTTRVVTGFFDGHAAAVPPAELLDMRRWSPRATSADYDYVP